MASVCSGNNLYSVPDMSVTSVTALFDPPTFVSVICLISLCVDAAGAARIVVVVAAAMFPCTLPGVYVVVVISTYETV